jgi:hypothetical protein
MTPEQKMRLWQVIAVLLYPVWLVINTCDDWYQRWQWWRYNRGGR